MVGQMFFLPQKGFRVVAPDRRGYDRSRQAFSGNDIDGYANDLAALIEALDLKDVSLVGHSRQVIAVTQMVNTLLNGSITFYFVSPLPGAPMVNTKPKVTGTLFFMLYLYRC